MATEREIDEAVARKLGTDKQPGVPCWCGDSYCEHREGYKPYTTSIAAAWEIVEHLKKTENCGLQLNSDDLSATCWIGTRHMQKQFADAKTLPMAICLAFLKLENSNE